MATNIKALRWIAVLALGLALALATAGAQAGEPAPHISTGGVAHATATSGELKGAVNPHGIPTTYFFEYGPTTAYGTSTKPVAVPLPSSPKAVPVGQAVSGLHVGYHYRIAATYTTKAGVAKGPIHGLDKVFNSAKASKLRFVIPNEREERISVSYGANALLTGSLTGFGNAGRALTLQATPYPFTASFATVDTTIVSGTTGGFAATIKGLTENTEFRFLTDDLRPLYSPTLVVHVTPKITLHVRGGGHTGLYRLYGTVTPARKGAPIAIQQLLPQKAGSRRTGPRAHSVGTGVLKRGKPGTSRFSIVVKLSGTFRYRAYVRLPQGTLSSGNSAGVLIRGPKGTVKSRK